MTPTDMPPALTLVTPSQDLLVTYRAALAEFHAAGEHLELHPDLLPEHVRRLAERGTHVPEGRVPESVYWGVVDGEYVGRVSLRHHLTPALDAWGGHVGYEVRPSRRGQGYGHRLLAAVLPHARTLGLTRVLLQCDDANAASARIIEGAGGVLERHVTNPHGEPGRRYWIELDPA